MELASVKANIRAGSLASCSAPNPGSNSLPPSTEFPVEDAQIDEPPDGGLTAWLQIIAGILANAMTWGYSASFGVYQLHYTTTLSLPPSQVSWVGSVQIFLCFFVGVFAGRSADAGYARITVAIGSALLVLGTMMTSLAETYVQIFLAQGVCTGLGMGIMYMPAVAVIGTYWRRRKAMAIGMSASGSGLGAIVFPLTVARLEPSIGFPWAVRVQGFIILAFAIVANVLLRPRLPPRKAGPLVEWSAFLEPAYVLFTSGAFLLFWAIYFALFYINTFATSAPIFMSTEDAANVLVIISAAGVPARPIAGLLADRYYGALPTFVVCSLSLAAVMYAWIAVDSVPGLYAWAVIYGVATAAAQGIFEGALVGLTEDLSKLGTRFGMVFSILAFATLAGPPTAGGLIEKEGGSFRAAQIWGGTVTVAGAFLIACARWWQVRSKIRSGE